MRVDAARPAHRSIAVEHELRAEPHPLVGQVRDLRNYRGHDRTNTIDRGIQLLVREAPRVLEEAGPVVGVVAIRTLEHLLGVRVNVPDACEHLTNVRCSSRYLLCSTIGRYFFAI